MIVMFADLAGFTALAEAHGDARAAQILDRFVATAQRVGSEHEMRFVRSIGDAVLLTGGSATAAMDSAVSLVKALDSLDGFPAVHVGMHAGDVMERGSDVIGRTVNLAARIAAAAPPDSIYVTGTVLQKGSPPSDSRVAAVGGVRLRNLVQPVKLFELKVGLSSKACDPVCKMKVDPAMAPRLRRCSQTYHFCSSGCAAQFSAAPKQYAPPQLAGLRRLLQVSV